MRGGFWDREQRFWHREHRFWKSVKSVHDEPECLFTFRQNRCSRQTRISVHDGPEYAPDTRLQTDLVNHVLNSEVQGRVRELAEAETEVALKKAQASFSKTIERQITDQAGVKVSARLAEIDDEEVKRQIQAAVLPPGSVVAFDRDGLHPGGCATVPGGWEDVGDDFEGRFILVAGKRVGGGEPFAPGPNYVGGAYVSKFLLEHSHKPQNEFSFVVTKKGSGWYPGDNGSGNLGLDGQANTDVTGSRPDVAQAQDENMPPYVPLTWCRKV